MTSANRDAHSSQNVSRRHWLQGAAGLTAATVLSTTAAAAVRRARPSVTTSQPAAVASQPTPVAPVVTKGRIKQSVCQWCFKDIPLETFARDCAAMGLKSIELVDPKDWPILKKYGLICALTSSHDLTVGFNDKANHEPCIAKLKEQIDACAAAGFPTVITFSGLRKGIPDDVGLDNTVEGLKKVVGYAEEKKVNLCIEVLNSRVDVEMKGHPDYMCDKVEWAAEVCKRISSPRMGFLFDVYHIQIMEGDVITRIKQFHQYVNHYHVAGVPGRNELDENQELNYPAILKTILATGYQGYVAQEFIPTRDPMQSLREAVKLCDI